MKMRCHTTDLCVNTQAKREAMGAVGEETAPKLIATQAVSTLAAAQ